MARMMKTAITIPKEDFEIIETMRKNSGKSRSQILVDAFHAWLQAKKIEEAERQYEESYRLMPESPDEAIPLAAEAWPKEDFSAWEKKEKA